MCDDDDEYFTTIFDEELDTFGYYEYLFLGLKISPKFINLKRLDLDHSDIESIPDTLVNLEYLDISFTNILSIPDNFVNLKELHTNFCRNLSHIPDTLINLEILKSNSCNFKTISPKFVNLVILDCSSNDLIEEIPDTLINLKKLSCWINKIKKIPDTLTKLVYLDCSCNEIKELPNTLINLKLLDIKYNKIKELPNTFTKLYYLNALETNVTYIPDSYKNLRKIRCKRVFCATTYDKVEVDLSNLIYYEEIKHRFVSFEKYYFNTCFLKKLDLLNESSSCLKGISGITFDKYKNNVNNFDYKIKKKLDRLYKALSNCQIIIKHKYKNRKGLKMLYSPDYVGGYLAKRRISNMF